MHRTTLKKSTHSRSNHPKYNYTHTHTYTYTHTAAAAAGAAEEAAVTTATHCPTLSESFSEAWKRCALKQDLKDLKNVGKDGIIKYAVTRKAPIHSHRNT